jgi:small subunit ribosomal protein S16
MKKMGRTHRPFFRLCAVDSRNPRDGKVIEELGYYDPMVREVDARAILNGERINYWISVGAALSEKAKVLVRKYGANGTHLEAQKLALQKIKSVKPQAPAPYKPPPKPVVEPAAAAPEGAESSEAPAENAE